MTITLPKTPSAAGAGRFAASDIAGDLHAAFWLHGRADGAALYVLTSAHARFAELAAAMGYSIAPLVVADGVAE